MPGAGCLRCVHPVPSTAEAGRSCAEVGVLGPVPGLIGCMEAIEAIKILVMRARVESSLQLMIGRQMYLDAAAGSCFEFTLPVRNLRCPLCGESPTILSMHDGAAASAIGAGYSVVAPSLSDNNEITAWDYFDKILVKSITHVLVDVRAAGQFNMLNLEPALELHKCCVKYLSLPLARIKKMGTEADLSNALQDPEGTLADIPIFVLCRRGVDSVTATIHIQSLFEQAGAIQRNVKNIKGGLVAWRRDVDNQFPNY